MRVRKYPVTRSGANGTPLIDRAPDIGQHKSTRSLSTSRRFTSARYSTYRKPARRGRGRGINEGKMELYCGMQAMKKYLVASHCTVKHCPHLVGKTIEKDYVLLMCCMCEFFLRFRSTPVAQPSLVRHCSPIRQRYTCRYLHYCDR